MKKIIIITFFIASFFMSASSVHADVCTAQGLPAIGTPCDCGVSCTADPSGRGAVCSTRCAYNVVAGSDPVRCSCTYYCNPSCGSLQSGSCTEADGPGCVNQSVTCNPCRNPNISCKKVQPIPPTATPPPQATPKPDLKCEPTGDNPCGCKVGTLGCENGTNYNCCHKACVGTPGTCLTVPGAGSSSCSTLSEPCPTAPPSGTCSPGKSCSGHDECGNKTNVNWYCGKDDAGKNVCICGGGTCNASLQCPEFKATNLRTGKQVVGVAQEDLAKSGAQAPVLEIQAGDKVKFESNIWQGNTTKVSTSYDWGDGASCVDQAIGDARRPRELQWCDAGIQSTSTPIGAYTNGCDNVNGGIYGDNCNCTEEGRNQLCRTSFHDGTTRTFNREGIITVKSTGQTSCNQDNNRDNPCIIKVKVGDVTPPPPTPTFTPIPTNTPTPTITPTPTGTQPTAIITQPEKKNFTSSPRAANQRFVCLQADPCAGKDANGNDVVCSAQGEDPSVSMHRVRLTTKANTSTGNGKIWILECIQKDGIKCTTGDPNLDKTLMGREFYSYLTGQQGYKFNGLFSVSGNNASRVTQVYPNNPVQSVNGKIQVHEWDSRTRDNLGRIFVAMSEIGAGGDGEVGGQQQGTLFFDSTDKRCVMIKWDPYGLVFDANTLEPLSNVKITLLEKTETGTFAPFEGKNIPGGVVNPILSENDGGYNFLVPDGVYKLQINDSRYALVTDSDKVNPKASTLYSDIYHGGEILQAGETEHHDIPVIRKDSVNTSCKDERMSMPQ
jgi:hypothetical protein